MGTVVNVPHIEELGAYEDVMKAVVLAGGISFEVDETLTAMRDQLHITDDEHQAAKEQALAHPEVQAIQTALRIPTAGSGLKRRASQAARSASGTVGGSGVLPQMGSSLSMPPLSMDAPPLAMTHGARLNDTQHSMIGGNVPGDPGAPQALAGLSERPHGFAPPPKQPRRTTQPSIEESQRGGGSAKRTAAAAVEAATPAGVSLTESDLRGYAVERRASDVAPWQRCVIVSGKRENRGQRLTVLHDHGLPSERFEHDVFLPKSKAGILWRFVKPDEKVELDWADVAQRAAADAPPTPAKAAPSKGKRKAVPPAAAEVAAAEPARLPQGRLAAALTAAQASGDCVHLVQLLADVQRRRAVTREAVAVEWCREVCAQADEAGGIASLQTQLEKVQQKQRDVQSELSGLSVPDGLTVAAMPVSVV